jgi:hypothetical protein
MPVFSSNDSSKRRSSRRGRLGNRLSEALALLRNRNYRLTRLFSAARMASATGMSGARSRAAADASLSL